MVQRAHSRPSEEVEAAERAVLGLTAVVGLQAGLISAVVGEPLALIGVPAIALVVLLAGGSMPRAAYAGAVVWAMLLPHAMEEALIVPVAMAVACLAIAIGPDRLMAWVRDDFSGPTDRGDAAPGWIEEDPRA